MSGYGSSNSNGSYIVSGPDIIQVSDFYVKAGVIHPIIIGSIAVISLFAYLRIGSNRSITPITTFDWLINVALGSTLAGIVNGNSLVRGLLGLAIMLAFQYAMSMATSRFGRRLSWLFQSPPLVVVFRGKMLTEVMKQHRISPTDINAAFRQEGVLNVCQVECGIIEPNGIISVFTMKALKDAKVAPDVLTSIPQYKKLCDRADEVGVDDAAAEEGTSDEETENGRKRNPV